MLSVVANINQYFFKHVYQQIFDGYYYTVNAWFIQML